MKFFRPLHLALALTAILPAAAQDPFDPFGDPAAGQRGGNISEIEVLVDTKAIAPGVPFTVSLKITHPESWHSYFHYDGFGSSEALSINWTLPDGFSAGEIRWPVPHRAPYPGIDDVMTYSYEGTNYFSTVITPPANLEIGSKVTIELNAKWQTCEETCVNESTKETLTFPTQASAEPNTEVREALATFDQQHIPGAAPDKWIVTSQDDGKNVSLRIETGEDLPSDLYFFDYDGQMNGPSEQVFTSSSPGVWDLTLPRNMGDSLFSNGPGPVLGQLKGILASHDQLPGADKNAVWIEATFAVVSKSSPTLDASEHSLIQILGLAFLGGLILNLMPCVFPVLGLKVMGFVQQAGDDPAKIRKHGLVFAAGLLVSLWILAGILIALVVIGGQYLGWGFQLNDPRFLAVMIMIFFIMGLNLSGLFEFGTSMTGVGGNLAHKKGFSGSFFSGVLTTLVATPCTGPFLGVAMTFALQQPLHISFLVFTALGLGIASPYLLLSFSPKLLKKLPKPGAWMETFKKALAFPLYITVVYFLSGFGAQTGISGIVWLLTALVVMAIALWIYGECNGPGRSKRARTLGTVGAIMFGLLGTYTTVYAVSRLPEGQGLPGTHLGSFKSTPWEPGIVQKLQEQGHVVFVDYTSPT